MGRHASGSAGRTATVRGIPLVGSRSRRPGRMAAHAVRDGAGHSLLARLVAGGAVVASAAVGCVSTVPAVTSAVEGRSLAVREVVHPVPASVNGSRGMDLRPAEWPFRAGATR